MNKNCSYNPVTKIWSGLSFTPLYSIEANLGQTILQRLIQHPTDIFQISDDTGVELTNSETYKRSLKFINYFMNLGLKQNDVVGLMAMNSENVTPLMFACFTLGIAVNPLMVAMGEQEIKDHWSRTKPKVVFCDGIVAAIVNQALSQIDTSCKIHTLVDKIEGFLWVDDILLNDFDFEEFE